MIRAMRPTPLGSGAVRSVPPDVRPYLLGFSSNSGVSTHQRSAIPALRFAPASMAPRWWVDAPPLPPNPIRSAARPPDPAGRLRIRAPLAASPGSSQSGALLSTPAVPQLFLYSSSFLRYTKISKGGILDNLGRFGTFWLRS